MKMQKPVARWVCAAVCPTALSPATSAVDGYPLAYNQKGLALKTAEQELNLCRYPGAREREQVQFRLPNKSGSYPLRDIIARKATQNAFACCQDTSQLQF
jgi:hypothetical protein